MCVRAMVGYIGHVLPRRLGLVLKPLVRKRVLGGEPCVGVVHEEAPHEVVALLAPDARVAPADELALEAVTYRVRFILELWDVVTH